MCVLSLLACGGGSSAGPCAAGTWCREAHEGTAGAASSDNIAQFAGPVTAAPLAAFRSNAWATRDASGRWTYNAFPAPAGDESSVSTVMSGYSASTSWVGVANGAVYHWSQSLGARGFSPIEGATAVAAVARSADDLWVVIQKPATGGSRGTVHARLWRAGAWSEFAVTSSGSLSSTVVGAAIDADGTLLILQYTQQPPGYLAYTIDRVGAEGSSQSTHVQSIGISQPGVAYGPGSILRDSVNGLWVAAQGQLWHRGPSATAFTRLSMPVRVSRVLPSERGVAAVFAASVSPDVVELAEIDVATEAVSPRAIEGAAIGSAGLHVTNAALWRVDSDASFWRLAAR